MARERITSVVDCVVALTLVLASNHLLAEERRADANSDVLEEFSFAHDSLVLLPVTLREKTYSFYLDTGATYSIFDTSLVKHLGQPVRRRTIATMGSKIASSEFAMPALQVGRLKPPPGARVVCASLLEVQQALDEPVDGLIGMDFLRGHIIQLDFDDQKVRFLKSVPSESGDRFPIVFGTVQSENVPRFSIKLSNAAAVFSIDTGFTGTLSVNSQMFDELDVAGRVGLRSTAKLATAGGTLSQLTGRLDKLTVGQFTHRDLILDRQPRHNVLGLGYLERFVVTFDFPQQVMYLKPGEGFNQIEKWDLSGLHVWRVKGEVVIDAVDSGSPAESVDLRPKDVVVQVDDQPATGVPLENLRALLRDSARTVALTIRRGELTRSVELKPKEFRMKPSLTVESSR